MVKLPTLPPITFQVEICGIFLKYTDGAKRISVEAQNIAGFQCHAIQNRSK